MFTFSIESDVTGSAISFKSSNLEVITRLMTLVGNVADAELDDAEEVEEIGGIEVDELEFDDEGFAWWYDADYDEWYWYNEEEDLWEEAEYEEDAEDEESDAE